MTRMPGLVCLMLMSTAFVVGCGPKGVEQKTYKVQMPSGLEQAKQLLQHYADGQSVGSEATNYPEIVAKVRESDPEKADLLEKGFAEIRESKGNTAAKAKQLLEKL